MFQMNSKLLGRRAYSVPQSDCRIRLDANESPINAMEEYREEIKELVLQIALNRYPQEDNAELRQAFARYAGIPADCVIAGNGSDEMIGLLIACTVNNDESLMLIEPDFSMYQLYAETYEKQLVCCRRPVGSRLTPEFLIEQLERERPALLLLSNPASPFADVLSKDEVLCLARAADKTGTLLAVDEAYMDFADQSVLAEVPNIPNLVVLRTFSKAWGLAALRIGFMIAPAALAERLDAFRPPYNIGTLNQKIACLMLNRPEHLQTSVRRIVEQRDQLAAALQEYAKLPGIKKIWPSVTNFIYIEIEEDFPLYEELQKRSILVRHLPGAIRLTVGTAEENAAVLAAMREIGGAYAERN